MSRNQQVSTRLPDDDAEKLERYCDEKQVSKAEALRRSVRNHTDPDSPETDSELYRKLILTGLVFVLVSQSAIVPSILSIGFGAVLALGLAYGTIRSQ